MMLSLCWRAWGSSLSGQKLLLCLQGVDGGHISIFSRTLSAGVVNQPEQLKLYKRAKKNDPLLKHILKLPESERLATDIASQLGCDISLAKVLIRKDSSVLANSKALEKIKLLQEYGYSIDDIVATPAVLHRSIECLKKRLDMIKSSVAGTESFSLKALTKPEHNFERLYKKLINEAQIMEPFSSKESFIAKLLQCDEATLTISIARKAFRRPVSPVFLRDKINALLHYGVPHDFIRENPNILFYFSVSELERRLSLLSDHMLLCPEIKLCYLLTCQKMDFSKSLAVLQNNREALDGCKDRLEYICLRCGCSEVVAKGFLESLPVTRVSNVKLKSILDFLLLEAKMKPADVLRYIVIFKYSVHRLRSRWHVMQTNGYMNVNMLPVVIALSDAQFSAKYGNQVYIDTYVASD